MLTSKSYYAIIKEKGLTPDVKYSRGDYKSPEKTQKPRCEAEEISAFFHFFRNRHSLKMKGYLRQWVI